MLLLVIAIVLLGANLTACIIAERRTARLSKKVDAIGWDVWAVKRAFQAETVAARLHALRRKDATEPSHLRAVKPGKTPQK